MMTKKRAAENLKQKENLYSKNIEKLAAVYDTRLTVAAETSSSLHRGMKALVSG
jgi:hypothetical protein